MFHSPYLVVVKRWWAGLDCVWVVINLMGHLLGSEGLDRPS
jgi:hypothetical protein